MPTKSLSRKQVRETKYGQAISAYVILKNGKIAATVHAAHLDSGSVMVDVYDKNTIIFQGRAGGYGYDKFTAALTGATIDGHRLYNHSEGVSQYHIEGVNEDYPELSAIYNEYIDASRPRNQAYWNKKAEEVGARFANWTDKEGGHYISLYYASGMDRLEYLGYEVVKVI